MTNTEFFLLIATIYIAPHSPAPVGIPIGLFFIALSYFFK